MANKKEYFKERTVGEIRKLNSSESYNHKGIIQSIDDLNPLEDSLEIRVLLIPGKFRRGGISQRDAANKYRKHGPLIKIDQPQRKQQALDSRNYPLDYRIKAFEKLEDFEQREIEFVGYYWRPASTTDQIARIVSFGDIAEGARIFTYAENNSRFKQRNPETKKMEWKYGIKVEPYADAQRVRDEGADVVVHIPSRTEKKEKYKFKLSHVPYEPTLATGNNLAVVSRLKPAIITSENGERLVGRTPSSIFDIRYRYTGSIDQSEVIRLTPQDVSGYLGIIKRQLEENMNWTALTFNPFALPSRKQAEFYTKLCNNVVIFDPTIEKPKHKLRKLYMAEKSMLLGRAMAHFGHEEFSFWNPQRDGKYKTYNWSPEQISGNEIQ